VASSDNTRVGPLSIMSLAREVNHEELEWEEDYCDREPAAMRNAIVEEADCYEDFNKSTATTTTSGYCHGDGGCEDVRRVQGQRPGGHRHQGH
jgi:hypothetical protein